MFQFRAPLGGRHLKRGLALSSVFAGLALASVFGADLRSLVEDYESAKAKLKGLSPRQRDSLVKDELRPKLVAIGKLDTPAGLKFLDGELDAAPPDLAGACAAGLLAAAAPEALHAVLGGFSKRALGAKTAILAELAATDRDLRPAEALLIDCLRVEKQPEALPSFADVLGKLESPRAAAALLQAVKDEPPGRGKAVEDAEAYSRAVVEALKRTRSDEVKGWIAGEGFKRAGPGRLQVLLRLVAALKLEAARGAVIESLGHPSAEVAQAAVEAIERIGLGDDAGKLEELLSKGKKPSLALRIQILDALAVSGSESGMAVVMKAARDTDPETRAIALGSLGRRLAAPGAVEALIAGLEDPAHEVRNAALRALNRARARPMIGALIRFIEKEKDEKLRLDALQLLIRASGKNMGLLTDDWRKWWSVAEASFEFPKDDGKAITSVKSYDLEYFGIEVSSKRIAFLVDASSSMLETVPVKSRPEDSDDEAGAAPGRTKGAGKGDGGNAGAEKRGRARKIDILKKELSRVIQKLPADTHINIVYFHSNYSSWKKELHPLAGPGRKQAVDFVQGLQNGQGTNVFDTLEFALKDKRVDTIFLLTDGLPTRGRLTEPAAIRREIGIQNRVRGATINCIAFGEESPLLKDLAAENGGVYRFVDSY